MLNLRRIIVNKRKTRTFYASNLIPQLTNKGSFIYIDIERAKHVSRQILLCTGCVIHKYVIHIYSKAAAHSPTDEGRDHCPRDRSVLSQRI